MPPRLNDLPTSKVVKAFQRGGWHKRTRKTRGPHHILTKEEHEAILSIPRHRTIKKGLLLKQIKKAGMTVEEFLALYR